MDVFIKRLREGARTLNLSDAEVARRAGLHERRYGHYVTGNREPNLETLVRICAVLATTPNYLLGFEGGKVDMEGSGRTDASERKRIRFKRALKPRSLFGISR